jgi:hypothetical protein
VYEEKALERDLAGRVQKREKEGERKEGRKNKEGLKESEEGGRGRVE